MKALSQILPLFKALTDFVALWLAFIFAFVAASGVSHMILGKIYLDLTSPFVSLYVLIFLVFSTAIGVLFYSRGHYTQRMPWWDQTRQVVLVLLAAIIIQGFAHYILKYPLSRLWVTTTWVLGISFVLIGRLIVRSILLKFKLWQVPTTIIGSIENILEVSFALYSDRYAGFAVEKIIILSEEKLTPERLPASFANCHIEYGIKNAEKFLEASEGFIILAPDHDALPFTEKLISRLQHMHREFSLVPPLLGVSLYEAPQRSFFGHNVVMFNPNQKQYKPFSELAKRLMDIMGSALLLIFLSPIFITIGWLIKKESPSSRIFFSHKRVGAGGKMFPCYKFTSMIPNAQEVLKKILAEDPKARKEWERDFKLKNDPRITRIGRILRKTSLDELPQLYNVLRGEMSLVGPRPIVQDETQYYGEKLDYYLSTKPGMTGLWQTSGRNDTSYEYRVYLDTWYAIHRSFWHDVVILFKTIKIVLNRAGAY